MDTPMNANTVRSADDRNSAGDARESDDIHISDTMKRSRYRYGWVCGGGFTFGWIF